VLVPLTGTHIRTLSPRQGEIRRIRGGTDIYLILERLAALALHAVCSITRRAASHPRRMLLLPGASSPRAVCACCVGGCTDGVTKCSRVKSQKSVNVPQRSTVQRFWWRQDWGSLTSICGRRNGYCVRMAVFIGGTGCCAATICMYPNPCPAGAAYP
jgi:hypothetical protein